MNQILITGDEVIKEPVKKQKKVIPTKGIAAFYAICTIILGICMITGSVYANGKINAAVEASKKPVISVERNDEDNTIAISVTHVRNIKTVTYRWNEEEEINIDGNDRKNLNETIALIGGKNTLTVTVTEENGQTSKLEKTFMAGNIPKIELSGVDNGVQITVTCDENIDYIQYSWDNGNVEKIEVGEKEYQGIINAPRGEHLLKIEVVDINGMKGQREEMVTGDTDPTLTVKSQLINGKATFVIDAEDDENIKTITIIHNGGEQETITVNAKTYHHEVTMTKGEINTIIVTATNKNNLTKTQRVRFKNM